MSKEIEKLAKQHGAEAEYHAAERIADGIVATLNAISWLARHVRSGLIREPAGVAPQSRRDLASS